MDFDFFVDYPAVLTPKYIEVHRGRVIAELLNVAYSPF